MSSNDETRPEDDGIKKTDPQRILLIKLLVGLCVLMCITMIVCIIAVVIVNHDAMVIAQNTGCRQTNPKPDIHPTLTKKPSPLTMYKVCKEAHCIQQAATIEASLDRSVKPCDDFYSFACGGWMKKGVIPDDSPVLSRFEEISSFMTNISRELLEIKVLPTDLQVIKNRKIMYRSCMDSATIESRGISPIMDFLKTHKLSWPIIDPRWSESTSDLQTQAVRYAQLGFWSIFSLSVTQDPEKVGSKIFQVGTNPITRFESKSNYNNAKKINMLRQYYTNISEILAPGENHTQDIEDVIQYEIESSKLWYNPGEKPENKYLFKRLTLRQLKTALPANFIDIEDAMKQVLSFGSINIAVTGDMPVYVPDYNMTLKNAVKTLGTRNMNRTLMNALGFAAIGKLIMYMPKNMTDISSKYEQEIWGSDLPERETLCSSEVMMYATTRMYADNYFPVEQRKDIENITLAIKHQMQTLITLNNWMDKPTKRKARDKLQAMTFNIAYPKWILNDAILNEYYKLFVFKKSEALENMVRHHTEDFANNIKEYNYAHTMGWSIPPLEANANYDAETNSFYMLAGILNRPLYDYKQLAAMNYGAIGMFIGHEITHGFDNNGRNRDGNGKFINWWTDKSRKAYDQRADCIKKQYGSYVIKQINKTLNANLTIGEDIADMGGIKMAFLAYQNLVSERGREKKLYGLNYTPEQLLFIQFAQSMCMKVRDKYMLELWGSNEHTVGRYRIIGALSGFPGFVNTFQCPRGSFMNNNKYCNMW